MNSKERGEKFRTSFQKTKNLKKKLSSSKNTNRIYYFQLRNYKTIVNSLKKFESIMKIISINTR